MQEDGTALETRERQDDAHVSPGLLSPKAIAIIAFAEDLAHRGQVLTQKEIARHLGIGESTLRGYRTTCEPVDAALRPVLPPSASQKVARALEELLQEGAVITHVLIAQRADVGANTVSRVKYEDPDLGRQIDAAVAASLFNRIQAAIQKRGQQGMPVTQKWLAEELGVGESSIVGYKNGDPAICRIIDDARPSPAAAKVRAAIEDLKAESVPATIARIVDRTKLNQGTVSKLKQRNHDLAEVIVDAPRPSHRLDRPHAEELLAARIHLYGDESCNTVSALNRSRIKGGNRTLLQACRRLHIPLPKDRPQALDALASYLHRIADTKPLFEVEAVGLWDRAIGGDREAEEDLLVRTRPLVKFVLTEVLHEDIHPASFRHGLIEHLISQGDFLITGNWRQWDGKGGLLQYFGRILREGLIAERLAFYYRRKVEERLLISFQAPLAATDEGNDSFTLENTLQVQSTELPPAAAAGILHDPFPFNEDEMVMRRDASSGIRVILPVNKQVLAATLRAVFLSPDLSAAFRSGVRNDWAVFMVGSTGRLGTAVFGKCEANLIILTEATDIFTRQTLTVLGECLAGRLTEHPGFLPTIVIGKGADHERILAGLKPDDRQSRIVRNFASTLNTFGVGLSARNGVAVIEAATVGSAEGTASHLSDIELYFQTAKNGIPVAVSREGADNLLIKKLIRRMSKAAGGESDTTVPHLASEILDFELDFLEGQRALLEKRAKT